jgi:plasmid stabilization system protein ParE
MARIEISREVTEDFDRILDHLARFDIPQASQRIEEIITALDVLLQNPLIGRPVAGGLRELVIGHDTRGYLALYRYESLMDTVFVLAIRSQREAGYVTFV